MYNSEHDPPQKKSEHQRLERERGEEEVGRGSRKSGTRLRQSTLQACVERPHSASSICTSSV